MAERPVEQLTLRDMFTNAEWLVRDLAAHLNQAFRPKSRALIELVETRSPEERDAIPDSTVRSNMAAILSSDDYSQTLFQKLDRYLAAIDERAEGAIKAK
jgi:hypothetical protein